MVKKFFKGKNILITGGTGSFGKELINYLLKNNLGLNKICVFSRDELKQYEIKEFYKKKNMDSSLRFLIGDIRDKDRLQFALNDIDIVINAAALKQVPAAEYNPYEFIKTNIIGAQNLIEACLNSKVRNLVALSTDKASSPANLYGATKLCSDKLFVSAQNTVGKKDIKLSVVRYGNVMGSRGSVLPKFLEQKKKGIFTVTHKDMTRFNITLTESVKFVINSIVNQIGGEIFVPKLNSFKIVDLCDAIDQKSKIKYIGIRPGEKMHEELISENESQNTYDLSDYYVILSAIFSEKSFKKYQRSFNLKKVKENFKYDSLNNDQFLTTKDLKRIIKSC